MNERSLLAVLFVPIAVALFAWSGGSAPARTDRNDTSGATPEDSKKKPTSIAQTVKPLKTACDLLRDYFDIADECPSLETAKANSVAVAIPERGGIARSAKVSGSIESAPKEADLKAAQTKILKRIGEELGKLKQIETLFVFVPDPNASTLALETDRALDAVRLAMSDAYFVPYKSADLPFRAATSGSSKSEAKKDEKEPNDTSRTGEKPANPGVWLFRSSDPLQKRLALVFLIGESPVVGISKPQFQGAIRQYLEYLPGVTNKFNIVGPVFSGSVDSIAKALLAERTAHLEAVEASQRFDLFKSYFHAVSGTATLPRLREQLEGLVPGGHVELDQLEDPAAFCQLVGALGNSEKTAVLAEGDTAYGEGFKSGEGFRVTDRRCPALEDIHSYNYSRSLLHLRVAYESDTDLMARIFPKSFRSNQLAFHFANGKEQIDTLPVYAPENFAVSQQITLRHLASYLTRSKFQNLIISGSDPLDMVFLARFFQEEAPNLRLAVLNSDVLLDREAGSVSLRGILSISKQPTGAVSRQQVELPSGTSFGIYRACRMQLGLADTPTRTVLSVVGFDGEWPILTFPLSKAEKEKSKERFVAVGPMIAFILLIIGLAMGPILAYWRLNSGGKGADTKFWLALYPFCVPVRDTTGSEQRRKQYIYCSLASGFLCLLAPTIFFLFFYCNAQQSESMAAEYPAMVARYFSFSNGVSPLLPLCVLLLALHAWVWSCVRSCFLQSYGYRPFPSPLPVGSEAGDVEMTHLLRNVEIPIEKFFGRSFPVIAAGIVLLMYLYGIRVTDFEVRPVFTSWSKWVWTILFGSVAILSLTTLRRFWMLWWGLRNLLRRLEHHPLRQAFSRLPDRLSWTSIWSITGLRPTMVSLQMTGDFLSALAERFDNAFLGLGPTGEKLDAERIRTEIDALMTKFYEGKFPLDAECYAKVQSVQVAIRAVCQNYIEALREPWKCQRVEGWQATKAKVATAKNENQKEGAGSGSGLDSTESSHQLTPLQAMKDEFIALQYCAYIRYAFFHLRNMLGFVGAGLTLLFIALNVYPFEPSGTLDNCATFLFSVATIVVIAVFSQMDRDALLSRLSETTAGKLDAGFGWRLFQFGVLPTVTFLAIHFPPIGQALVRIVQIIPGLAKQ